MSSVSGSPAERGHAVQKLYGNIFHQGSRYEATAYAAPFLAQLTLDRQVRGMHRAVDDPAAALRSALDELAAYNAVRAEVPRLRGLLGDGDPYVRAAVAYLAGWFPEEAPGSVSALRGLLAAEARPGVAATAVVSAGLLGDTGLVSRLRKGLSGPEPLVRWADAIALSRLGNAGADVTGVLAAACVEPPEPGTAGSQGPRSIVLASVRTGPGSPSDCRFIRAGPEGPGACTEAQKR